MKKYLKGKTWIDWVKVLLALDIAIVGIGLIFQESLQILANLLGPVSRIIFGILYLILAARIIKNVFPDLYNDLRNPSPASDTDKVIQEKKSVGEIVDMTTEKVDRFVQDRTKEVKDEIKKVLEE